MLLINENLNNCVGYFQGKKQEISWLSAFNNVQGMTTEVKSSELLPKRAGLNTSQYHGGSALAVVNDSELWNLHKT